MSNFDLDVKVTQSKTADEPMTITTTRTIITRTPVCTKTTCRCTTQGACTAGCPW